MENLAIYLAFAAPFCAAFFYIAVKHVAEKVEAPELTLPDANEPAAPRRVSKVYFG